MPKFKIGDNVKVFISGVWHKGRVAFVYHNPDYREHEYIVAEEGGKQLPVTLERHLQAA